MSLLWPNFSSGPEILKTRAAFLTSPNWQKTPGAANIAAYADIVRERSVLRQLVEVSGKISDSAFNPLGRKVVKYWMRQSAVSSR